MLERHIGDAWLDRLQKAAAILALVGAACWTLWNFNALKTRESAQLELEAEMAQQGTLAMSWAISRVCGLRTDSRSPAPILARLTLKNIGRRVSSLALKRDAVTILRLNQPGQGTAASMVVAPLTNDGTHILIWPANEYEIKYLFTPDVDTGVYLINANFPSHEAEITVGVEVQTVVPSWSSSEVIDPKSLPPCAR